MGEPERREMQLPGHNTGGLKCGHCGESLSTVAHVKSEGGFRVRRRMCDACKQVNITMERVVNTYQTKKYFSDDGE